MSMLESYQTNRFVDRLQALAQVVLVFLILAAVNYIGMRHYQRFDITQGRDHTLSAETLAYLSDLPQPIEVIVTIPRSTSDPLLAEALRDVQSLLSQYEDATRSLGPNRIDVEYLEIYQQTRRAKDLGVQTPNAIIFKSGDRKRQIAAVELYRKRGDFERDFLGESLFTRSILELIDESEPVLYFTRGHGELKLNDFSSARGGSQFLNELQSRNYLVKEIDLSTVSSVPEDASLIIVAAPQARFLPSEQELLRSFLRRKSGRLLIFLEPGEDHGLNDLFFDWGLLVDDTLVVERDPNFLVSGGDLMIRRFSVKHPITDDLYTQGIPLVSDRSRSVRADPGRPIDDTLIVTELMFTSDRSWGEKSYQQEDSYTYDPQVDIPPPVSIAAISERKVDSSLGISIPGGKVIVVGTANFITNNRIQASGNLYLALNAINYAIDRVSRLNIPPRPIRKVELDISMEQLNLTRYLIWLGPPLAVGLLGLMVYLGRRN